LLVLSLLGFVEKCAKMEWFSCDPKRSLPWSGDHHMSNKTQDEVVDEAIGLVIFNIILQVGRIAKWPMVNQEMKRIKWDKGIQ